MRPLPRAAILSVFLGLALAPGARAEYRLYKLGLRFTADPKEKETVVLSTLDDIQFQDYYRISANQTTRLIKHWMCRGRTDFRAPCPEPLDKTTAEAPAPAPSGPGARQPPDPAGQNPIEVRSR